MELASDQDSQGFFYHYDKDACKLPTLIGKPFLAERSSITPRPHRGKKAREGVSERKSSRFDGSARLIVIPAAALDSLLPGQLEERAGVSGGSEPLTVIVLQDARASKEAEKLRQEITALKEAEQQKDDFIATAAHELRRPLTALVGYAEMLKQQTAGSMRSELAEWQIEALETITHVSCQLVDLTNDLLDVTQLQAGKFELHRYTTDLVALSHRVIAKMRVTVKHHTLAIEAKAPRIAANIDIQRIEQVLINLLSNAIKYSPAESTVRLTIQEDQEAGNAVLAVHDQGIGIPPSQRIHIFNRFFRADNARVLGVEGAGLGLYLCRELVQQHGGRIWFESVEGEGSSFYVLLPLAI
jgi:signal transduction histidine kinase